MATGPELRIGHAEREAAAASLRDEAAQLGDDQYDHAPEPS